MILQDLNGNELQLTITNYQYPNEPADSNQWDLNWLLINIFIKTPLGHAEFADPALLTWEVSRLCDWLQSLASQEQINSSIYFIEPTLVFEVMSNETNKCTLRLYFRLGKFDSWVSTNDSVEESDKGGVIDFVLSSADLIKASHELATQLKRYPLRK